MDETLNIWLPPWFAISNSALKSNSLKLQLLLKFYKILFSSKCIWLRVCSMHNVTACKLMEVSAVKELPFHYSTCLSQLKHQIKSFWLKASMLHEKLLSNVPYATLCPIRNDMFMIFAY